MPVKHRDQTAMDERPIANDELESAVESFHNAREESRGAARITKEAKKKVVSLLDAAGVEDGETVRIGRFRIERTFTPGVSKTVNYGDSHGVELTLAD